MSDRSVTFTGSGTWAWPERGVRENKVYVTGCGGGGSGGAGGTGSYWAPESGYQEMYWEYDPFLGFDVAKYRWVVTEPAHWVTWSNGGGGGEAGESKSSVLVLSNTSSIGVTISGGVSFGSLFSCVAGNNGGNGATGVDATNFGAGGSGGPGADGGAGSRSAGGGGGSSGISGYGSGGSGGWNGGSPSAGQQGFITISWDDGSYCYVMEGE